MASKNDMGYAAIGAARSYLREQGVTCPTDEDAFRALDDLARLNPQLLAAYWWRQANKSQLAKFKTEWKRTIDK